MKEKRSTRALVLVIEIQRQSFHFHLAAPHLKLRSQAVSDTFLRIFAGGLIYVALS